MFSLINVQVVDKYLFCYTVRKITSHFKVKIYP